MTISRTFVAFAAGAIIGAGGFAVAQTAHVPRQGPTVKTLAAVDIREALDGNPTRATTLEVTFEPGVAGTPHRHPGPVFGYVLEGELEFQAGDEPVRRLKTGETFYEPAMVLHAVSRNPSDKLQTRVLAVMLHPKNAADVVLPEPPKAEK